MTTLTYNEDRDEMELSVRSNAFEAQFIVPPYMRDGDHLTPFKFRVFDGTGQRSSTFYLFGRYCEETDMVQYVVTGPPGHKYKLSFTDGNRPYGWKVKKHGMTRSPSSNLSWVDKLIGCILERFMVMAGKQPSPDYVRDIVKTEAYASEEIIGVPMAMMRLAHKTGVLDAKYKCIEPWSFYGPSLPEAFCRCRLKIKVDYDWNGKHDDPNESGSLDHGDNDQRTIEEENSQ